LKEGRIVALDRTENLLQAGAERRLVVDLDGRELPASLQHHLISRDGSRFVLDLPEYSDLEGILAALRAEGIAIRDLSLAQADLEEVFLKTMHGGAA
jgi:ABC-2 type transport system ATP-binding protein